MATEADEFASFADSILGQQNQQPQAQPQEEEDFSAFAESVLTQQARQQFQQEAPFGAAQVGLGGELGAPDVPIATGGGGVPVQEGQISPVAQGIGFGLERAAAGFEGFLRAFPSALPGIDVSTDFHQARRFREQQVKDRVTQLPEQSQQAFEIGRLGAELLPDVLAPGKNIVQRIWGSALLDAARPIEGDDPSLLSQERQFQAATGAGFASTAEMLTKFGKYAWNLGRRQLGEFGFFQAGKDQVQADALEGITAESTDTAVKAARRINGGQFLSPAEASAREANRIREGNIPLDRATQERIQSELIQREVATAEHIRQGIADIVPEGDDVLAKKVDNLYQRAHRVEVPLDVSESLMTDPLLKKTFDQVEKKPELKRLLDGYPPGTLGRWDLVKRQLDGRIGKEKNATIKNSLMNARDILVEQLDSLSPTYTQARKVAQRGIAKSNILTALDAVKGKPTAIDPARTVHGVTIDQFYDTILSTPKKRQKLLNDMGNSKISKQQIEDAATFLKALRGSSLRNLLNTTDNIKIRTGGFGFKGLLAINANAFLRGKYNRELAEFLTNPRWAGSLRGLNKIADKTERLEAAAAAMSRIGTHLLEEEDQNRELGGAGNFNLPQL